MKDDFKNEILKYHSGLNNLKFQVVDYEGYNAVCCETEDIIFINQGPIQTSLSPTRLIPVSLNCSHLAPIEENDGLESDEVMNIQSEHEDKQALNQRENQRKTDQCEDAPTLNKHENELDIKKKNDVNVGVVDVVQNDEEIPSQHTTDDQLHDEHVNLEGTIEVNDHCTEDLDKIRSQTFSKEDTKEVTHIDLSNALDNEDSAEIEHEELLSKGKQTPCQDDKNESVKNDDDPSTYELEYTEGICGVSLADSDATELESEKEGPLWSKRFSHMNVYENVISEKPTPSPEPELQSVVIGRNLTVSASRTKG